MEGFEDHSDLIDQAKKLHSELEGKIKSGEAKNYTEAQDRIALDEMFRKLAFSYEQGSVIENSIVRLDQEDEISADLDQGHPVLIRGNWRIGKTSMAYALTKHKYGAANTFRESLDILPEKDLKRGLQYGIAGFLAERLNKDARQIDKKIEQSGKDPFEYLSELMARSQESALVVLDEVIAHVHSPQVLESIANIGKLPNIKLAVILHRYSEFEEMFAKVFTGFKSHFVRPLTLEETTKLIRTPMAGTPVKITDAAIAKIQEITGGRPMEINNICHRLFHPPYDQKDKKPKTLNDVADLPDIENSAVFLDLEDTFPVAINTYKRIYGRSMSEEERNIINILIDQGNVPIKDLDKTIIEPLVETSFVAVDEPTQTYRINGSLFKKVVQDLRKKE